MAEQDRECEVVVVGAGYSGLAAARHLARAGVDVAGARGPPPRRRALLHRGHRGGVHVDRGGQWIGPTQDHLAALAAELGVATFPTYTEGQGVELRDGQTGTSTSASSRPRTPRAPPTASPACSTWTWPPSTSRSTRPGTPPTPPPSMRRRSPPIRHPPDVAPRPAPSWRSRSRRSSAPARASCRSSSPSSTSMPAAGSPTWPAPPAARRSGASPAARSSWPRAWRRSWGSGSSSAPRSSRSPTGPTTSPSGPGSSPGRRPRRRPHAAHRHACRSGPAAPSSPWRRPSAAGSASRRRCPGNRDQLCQRMPMGAVTKVHVLYDEPFWRADGLNGQIVAPGSVLESAFDNSPDDASHGAIVGFVAGDDCRRMEAAGPAARQAAVLDDLVRAFGPRARTPDRDRGAALAGRALHPRRARRRERARRADRARPGAARAGRAAALGRDGDGHGVVRLPRWRAVGRHPRRRRGRCTR